MGMFDGKKGLITGVFNKQSIAWSIADRIMNEGGECGFSYMPDKPDDARKKNLGRITKLTDGNPAVKFLQPMDVTNDEHIGAVMDCCRNDLGKIDFLLHSIAFALPDDLKGDTIATSRAGFKLAMEISVHSLIALANAAQDVLNDHASILTLTYFGGGKGRPWLQRHGHLQVGTRLHREVPGLRPWSTRDSRERLECWSPANDLGSRRRR